MCLVIVLFFLVFVGTDLMVRGDWTFHYLKASGQSDSANPPLWHALSSWFAYYDNRYVIAVLALLGIVTPMFLFQVTKSWQTVLFYFSTQYFWGVPAMSHTQALAGVFLVAFFLTKNNWLRFALFCLASVSHSMGWLMLGVPWLIFLVAENLEFLKNKLVFPGACGSTLGQSTPDIMNQHLYGHLTWGFSVGTIANFFLKVMPFPYIFFALKQLWREKKLSIIFVGFTFIFGSAIIQERILYCVPLIWLPWAGKYCKHAHWRTKLGFYVLAIALLALNAIAWWNRSPERMAEIC